MLRPIICAAVAMTAISFGAAAHAMPANPQLNAAAPPSVQLAQYYHHYHRHHAYRRYYRGWNSYAYSPYRYGHCWTVRTWHGWARRCNW
jgi:hypothetical protein